MWINPNDKSPNKPDITNFGDGVTTLFCPECKWQTFQPGVGMRPVCPDCGIPLHTIRMTPAEHPDPLIRAWTTHGA